MFELGASELLLIVIVAVVVIGPKDLPLAMRTVGRWVGKLRRMSGHFRAGIDAMIREAEMEELEREWKERNAEIMKAHPHIEANHAPAGAEAAQDVPAPAGDPAAASADPQLPPP